MLCRRMARYSDSTRRCKERRGKVAKVATARRLLEWIYHMMKDAKAFYQVEEAAESRDRGEPANCPGTVL